MQNMFHDPKNIIPLTQFAQEGASSIRERLQTEEPLILLQDDRPVAVVLSPEEYQRLGNLRRKTNFSGKPTAGWQGTMGCRHF